MEVITILLVFALLVISLLPTEATEIIEKKECKPHRWITKPSGIDPIEGQVGDNNYLVCEECGFLPDSDAYEEEER
jgi:hypothetical protein